MKIENGLRFDNRNRLWVLRRCYRLLPGRRKTSFTRRSVNTCKPSPSNSN